MKKRDNLIYFIKSNFIILFSSALLFIFHASRLNYSFAKFIFKKIESSMDNMIKNSEIIGYQFCSMLLKSKVEKIEVNNFFENSKYLEGVLNCIKDNNADVEVILIKEENNYHGAN